MGQLTKGIGFEISINARQHGSEFLRLSGDAETLRFKKTNIVSGKRNIHFCEFLYLC